MSKGCQDVINAVKWALDSGYRHIDIAAIYKNEEGVDQGIQEGSVDRKNVFVVS
ncbi:aldo/keto reductase [uncultured Croceitalea sp.]|uniref:aldo/keto reductase n=1 Tax=uncultured Croceitalea sp. TaxID=1798908 RepID=UPI0033062BF8